ncbi:hypothetical protein [Limnobacter parvus]|uniref:Uncharacterized protein n=1 Tax=Limnobacter parvus TaxID=2939690 RepID=A0ABT1XF76_9BURK|nr:hypothetical protein [Limnobacter parvus]MCR2745928.1 hypothetical protein [Limnobacter parvus]
MNPEELQNFLGNSPLPGASGTGPLFEQLGESLQPITEFDTIEPREMLYHSGSDSINNLLDSVPAQYRNFSDPSGFVSTQFAEDSSTNVTETRVFGRLIRSTETETHTRDESLTVGNDTPLQTVFSHTVNESTQSTTLPLTPALNNSSTSFEETFSIDNDLLSAGLTHTDTSATLNESPLLDTHSTTLNLNIADQAEISLGLSDLSLGGERVLEAITLTYPGLEGEPSSLVLPVSTNLLVPLALGTAEGFANNPDPTALLDLVTGIADLPVPIGSLTGGSGISEGLPSLETLG